MRQAVPTSPRPSSVLARSLEAPIAPRPNSRPVRRQAGSKGMGRPRAKATSLPRLTGLTSLAQHLRKVLSLFSDQRFRLVQLFELWSGQPSEALGQVSHQRLRSGQPSEGQVSSAIRRSGQVSHQRHRSDQASVQRHRSGQVSIQRRGSVHTSEVKVRSDIKDSDQTTLIFIFIYIAE